MEKRKNCVKISQINLAVDVPSFVLCFPDSVSTNQTPSKAPHCFLEQETLL